MRTLISIAVLLTSLACQASDLENSFLLKEIKYTTSGHLTCGDIDSDFFSHNSVEQCRRKTREMLGNALPQTDALRLVSVHSGQQNDFEFMYVTLSGFRSKETLTVSVGMIYEL